MKYTPDSELCKCKATNRWLMRVTNVIRLKWLAKKTDIKIEHIYGFRGGRRAFLRQDEVDKIKQAVEEFKKEI